MGNGLSQPNQVTLLPTELSYQPVLGDGSTIHMGSYVYIQYIDVWKCGVCVVD